MGDNTFGERGRDSRRKKFFPNNKVNPMSANVIWNVQYIVELSFNESTEILRLNSNNKKIHKPCTVDLCLCRRPSLLLGPCRSLDNSW